MDQTFVAAAVTAESGPSALNLLLYWIVILQMLVVLLMCVS